VDTAIKCPRCRASKIVKNGKINGQQRYLCKECNYHFTVNKLGKRVDNNYIVKALQLYLEGLGISEIEKYVGVSRNTIRKWIKRFENLIVEVRKNQCKINVVNLQDLIVFLKEKNEPGLILFSLGNQFIVFS
jgi:transposase-like protein